MSFYIKPIQIKVTQQNNLHVVYIYIYVMEWSGRTGHRQRSQSKRETTAGGRQQSGFIAKAADNFQYTQNPHSHA